MVRPRGVPGHVLRIDSVGGTPLLGAAGPAGWTPEVRVRSDGPVRRIELPVRPARCDDHVFMEAAGGTAFLVRLTLDGRPGQLVLRMAPAGRLERDRVRPELLRSGRLSDRASRRCR